MKKTIFTGAATAIITPFKDGNVDYASLEKIIEFQIKGGIDAIVVCGTTGESSTLSDDEHREVIDFAVKKINGRVPVIAGTGSNDTVYAVDLTKHAVHSGVDAVLVVTPYYNKATQAGLVKHYNVIADASEKPVMVYNVPSRTGVNIKPETYFKLSQHENIVAIKEANGDISSVAQTMSLCGNNIDLYSGNDDQITPILSLGGKGVISVLSNVLPYETSQICKTFFNGDVEKSRKLQLEYLKLINLLFCEVNPIPVKSAMALLGYCGNEIRMPLSNMEEANLIKLKNEMENLKLI